MAKYRLKEGFNHYEKGPHDPTPAGTIVTMSEKRYHSLRDRFELVSEEEVIVVPSVDETETLSADDSAEDEDYAEWVAEVAAMTAKVARDTVRVMDELDILAALLAAESRITVVAALEERIEEITS